MIRFTRMAFRGAAVGLLLGAGASVATAQAEAKLKSLGITLPPAQKAVANYVPAVRTGNLVFLAGQGPLVDGKPTIYVCEKFVCKAPVTDPAQLEPV